MADFSYVVSSSLKKSGLASQMEGIEADLDTTLSILWVVVFAIFGKMYIHEDPEGDKGVGRMKNAVWVDLINMLLWFMTSISGAVIFFFFRGGKSRFTGRATV